MVPVVLAMPAGAARTVSRAAPNGSLRCTKGRPLL